MSELFQPEDWIDPPRWHRALRAIQCPACQESGGAEAGATDDEHFLISISCMYCNYLISIEKLPSELILANVRPTRYIAGSSEGSLTSRLQGYLKPAFYTFTEVQLRHPAKHGLRADALAIPKPELAPEFPFRFVVVEVKRPIGDMKTQPAAFDQCNAYADCTLIDDRVRGFRGLPVDCVALYQGRMTSNRHERDPHDPFGQLSRLVGKRNIGELVHDSWHGLALLISEECIWSAKTGVTGVGQRWHAERPVSRVRRNRPKG